MSIKDQWNEGRRKGQRNAERQAQLRHEFWLAMARSVKSLSPSLDEWSITLAVISQVKKHGHRYSIGKNRHGAPRTVHDFLKRSGVFAQGDG